LSINNEVVPTEIIHKEVIPNEMLAPAPKSPYQVVDELFDELKGKFPLVLVLSVDKDQRLHINGNSPNFPTIQWLLQKASFEVQLHEREEFIKNFNNNKEVA